MSSRHSHLLAELWQFIRDEQAAAHDQLAEIWERPICDKVDAGWSQTFVRLEQTREPGALWAYLGEGESRFREGDMIALHAGSPTQSLLGRHLVFESEEDERWRLRGDAAVAVWQAYSGGLCYADPDAVDLTGWYESTLEEIAASAIGREVLLPLLGGGLEITFDDRDIVEGEAVALAAGFNPAQARAVGLAFGAEQLACIQGPPGTGKTRVLSLIVRLMIERGERVLVTSHTHMAINNALNKIQAQGVPTVKVGRDTQCKGLDPAVACHAGLGAWDDRPTNGYVVGATPFATCTSRLEHYEFDTIVFDEASQITMPLALMAMRRGRKFIFVGDHKQLPPVMLSRSVLADDAPSVFAKLTSLHALHTAVLNETYRMNRWLARWPSEAHYAGALVASGPNRERRVLLDDVPERFAPVFDASSCGVFIPTLDRSARTRNFQDAELVADLCEAAAHAGLAFHDIGIVTPYRAQGRAIRSALVRRFGRQAASAIVADTVERMQGQEREMVILSLASADTVFLSAVAPFFFQPQRLNVSITRAMTKLIVIGPSTEMLPVADDERVQGWIAQYAALLHSLKRVELPRL